MITASIAVVGAEFVDVILLAHNEVNTIEQEVELWHGHVLDYLPGSKIIVAEDGSTDGTSELLHRLEQEGQLRHCYSTRRRGYKGAFLDGLTASTAPYSVLADTGLKADPRSFWALWPYRGEWDLVVGRKVLRSDSYARRTLTFAYNRLIRTYFRLPNVHDADAGFRILSADFRSWLRQQDLLFSDLVNSEVVVRAVASGWRYREVPIPYWGRDGKSRGLPTKEIPSKVLRVLRTFPALKAAISETQRSVERPL